MTVKRRKKNIKHRGTRTCGWGLVHRGGGQKGGRGNSGRGKKANVKVPVLGGWTKQDMGKHGFINHNPGIQDTVINLRDLEDQLPSLIEQKFATEKEGVVAIDLKKAGYTKVLSSGKVTRKWKITAERASPGAVEKIKAAGGELTIKKVESKKAA